MFGELLYHLHETRGQRSLVPIKLVEGDKREVLGLWLQTHPGAPGRPGWGISKSAICPDIDTVPPSAKGNCKPVSRLSRRPRRQKWSARPRSNTGFLYRLRPLREFFLFVNLG